MRTLLIRTGVVGTGVGLFFLSACATSAKYQTKVRSWEGKDATALVQTWGQPDDKQTVHEGNTLYVYARLKREPLAFRGSDTMYANARNPAEYSSVYIKCTTYFEVNPQNKIIATIFRGEECKSKD